MPIKNLTVTAKTIKKKTKGLIDYINYLNNEKAPSHKNTDIIHIYGSENEFIKKCSQEAAELDLANQLKGKGGRPTEGLAISYNFILPKNSIRPTKEQWTEIARDLSKVLKENIDDRLGKNHVYMNVHDQNNPHLNMAVSKFIDGQRSRQVDQKSLLSKLKTEFNQSVLKHCDFDYRDYVPEEEKLGKRKQKWAHDKNQIQKALKQFENLVKHINENSTQARINTSENRLAKTVAKIEDTSELVKIVEQTTDPDIQQSIENVFNKANKITENNSEIGQGNTDKNRKRPVFKK